MTLASRALTQSRTHHPPNNQHAIAPLPLAHRNNHLPFTATISPSSFTHKLINQNIMTQNIKPS
jgi:hypothetical protein